MMENAGAGSEPLGQVSVEMELIFHRKVRQLGDLWAVIGNGVVCHVPLFFRHEL